MILDGNLMPILLHNCEDIFIHSDGRKQQVFHYLIYLAR